MPQGMATTPPTPGPPGISSSIPLKSNVNVLPTTIFPSHPSYHQAYASYPSIPPVVAPSHEIWFPSPQGGLPRPPLYPYSAPLPGPYAFQHPGMSLSASLPDMRPMGNTPMGTSGGIPIPSGASGAQFATFSVIQQDMPPVAYEKLLNNVNKDGPAIREELNAWTAHRTEAGVVYYYNALTGESTYGKPAGFKGEPEKVTAQTTPVSWEKLSGTDWTLVITNDGKKYYHNTKTQLSSWQIPHELTELSRKQAGDIVMEESISLPNNSVVTDKESPVSLNAPAIHSGGRDATSLRSPSVSASSALDLIKRKLQDSVVPASSSPVLPMSGSVSSETNGLKASETASKGHLSDNNKEKHGDEGNISESSSDSEDNESGPTKEESFIQFKEMLKERGVAPFSKWEKELPKIVFDPRFKAIPNYNTRRTLFEHYVRTRAEEERKEKRAAQKAAIDGFKQLLEEAKEDIDLNTNYQMFRKKWGNDPRFETLDRKDRESLLNERVLSLRKAAEQKAIALRAAVSFDFKAMLKEKGDIITNSRWSKVKDDLKDDPRCKSVKREDREILFNEFLSELKAAEEEVSRASKAKYEEHEKLKERERETRKRKEREEQEVERVRSKARRKEAVESYQALLVETLKDPKATWTESKPKLDKDPQGRSSNPYLDSSDLEKLFREHVKVLHERCMNDFRALLAETLTVEAGSRVSEDGKTVLNSWSTAKRIMKSDPRYVKMARKDRELLWQKHVEDINRRKKSGPDEEEEKNGGSEPKGRSLDSGKSISGRRIQQRS
ncbi:pre-mRNA-processing protein 40C isoform X2 [Impatiens glandulifera]|nr:pre-mRNA-processing protein 40C isoform X2 [Impatiens glandulifera]